MSNCMSNLFMCPSHEKVLVTALNRFVKPVHIMTEGGKNKMNSTVNAGWSDVFIGK